MYFACSCYKLVCPEAIGCINSRQNTIDGNMHDVYLDITTKAYQFAHCRMQELVGNECSLQILLPPLWLAFFQMGFSHTNEWTKLCTIDEHTQTPKLCRQML